MGKSSADDDAVDERCFDESCGRKYDPGGPLVQCRYLTKLLCESDIFLSISQA